MFGNAVQSKQTLDVMKKYWVKKKSRGPFTRYTMNSVLSKAIESRACCIVKTLQLLYVVIL